MSRFQLRKRLRARLDRALATEREEVQAIHVRFLLPDGSEHGVQTEPHYTLIMASQTLDTPINAPCPDGHCGDCQVTVLEGAQALRPATEAETELLDSALGSDRDPRVRLACHARLSGSGALIQVEQVWNLADMTGEPPCDQ